MAAAAVAPFNCWSTNPPVDSRQPLAVTGWSFIYMYILYICVYVHIVMWWKRAFSIFTRKVWVKRPLPGGATLNGRLKCENNRLWINWKITYNIHTRQKRTGNILGALGWNPHGRQIYTSLDRRSLPDIVVGFIRHY